MSEVVAKFGSSLVTDEAGLNQEIIHGFAAGLTETHLDDGKGLIVVTSGARAAGMHRAETMFHPDALARMTDQQFAALGATAVFKAWEEGFEELGVAAASIPITHRQLGGGAIWHRLFNREEKRMFANMLYQNAESGIVTIINEADAISVAELMMLKCGGDNDGLASHVSIAIEADELWLFTGKGGIFDNDGQLISRVDRHNYRQVQKMVDQRGMSALGRGGAATKTTAAHKAARAGVKAFIAQPNKDMTGENITRFVW